VRALILQHHPQEGPGTLGEFLAAQGAELDWVRTDRGEMPPAGPQGYELVISMGGPMNVYQEDRHPWLAPEKRLLAAAAHEGLVVLGFCLGAQLIAAALGGEVVKSPAEEIGWHEARLTPEAAGDALLAGLRPAFPVVQWHGDMFNPPPEGRLVATGNPCPHQAFAWRRAYGFQFHLEVDRAIVESWFPPESPGREAVLTWESNAPAMQRAADTLYQNLWAMLVGGGASRG